MNDDTVFGEPTHSHRTSFLLFDGFFLPEYLLSHHCVSRKFSRNIPTKLVHSLDESSLWANFVQVKINSPKLAASMNFLMEFKILLLKERLFEWNWFLTLYRRCKSATKNKHTWIRTSCRTSWSILSEHKRHFLHPRSKISLLAAHFSLVCLFDVTSSGERYICPRLHSAINHTKAPQYAFRKVIWFTDNSIKSTRVCV